MPTYTHLFITYSFCRIDDLTWGTKGLTSDVENKDQCNKESDKKYQKYKFLIQWIGSNVISTVIFYILFYLEIENILVIIIQSQKQGINNIDKQSILSFGVMFCIIQLAKFIGFFKYWISFLCSRRTDNRIHDENNNNKNNNNNNNNNNNSNNNGQPFQRKSKKSRSQKYKDRTNLLYRPEAQQEGLVSVAIIQ